MKLALRMLLCTALYACSTSDGARRMDASADAGRAPDAAAPDGDAGDDDAGLDTTPGDAQKLTLDAPASVAPGMLFTVAARSQMALSREVELCVGEQPLAKLRLYRGRGSVSITLDDTGAVQIRVCSAGLSGSRKLQVEQRSTRALQGMLAAADANWAPSADVHVSGDLIVPAGLSLRIAAGTRVLFATNAALIVRGTLLVSGTQAKPVIFTRAGTAAWGGIRVEPNGSATLDEVWLNSGGGDTARVYGHSKSQPVLWVEEAELTMRGGGLVDNVGKALGSEHAVMHLDGVLISRCDTGGNLGITALTMERGFVLEMPDADGSFDDDDNDGIYLRGAYEDAAGKEVESVLRDMVFAVGEDDAIDHNDALLRIERTWIEGFRHEGLAASVGHRVTISDSMVRDCEQGIEAGYGTPEVIVERCTVTDNDVGLRVGDSYDWDTDGHMRVSETIAIGNRVANVRNHVNQIMGPLAGALEIACSMVDDPALDAVSGNAPGIPAGSWKTRGCAKTPAPTDAATCGAMRRVGTQQCF